MNGRMQRERKGLLLRQSAPCCQATITDAIVTVKVAVLERYAVSALPGVREHANISRTYGRYLDRVETQGVFVVPHDGEFHLPVYNAGEVVASRRNGREGEAT